MIYGQVVISMSIIGNYKESLSIIEKIFEDLEEFCQENKEGYMGYPEDFVDVILKKFEELCLQNSINVEYDGNDLDTSTGILEEYYLISPEIVFTIDANQVDVDPRDINRKSLDQLNRIRMKLKI